MRRWVFWLGLLGNLSSVSVACTSSSNVFTCASDSDCTGEGNGSCQSNGFCAFPDAMCDSGSRYGELAGGGFANACVPLDEPGETDSAVGSTGAGTSNEPTTTTTSNPASSVTTEAPTSSTDTSSATDGESSATTQEPAACEILFLDEFDDKELWPDWEFVGTGTVELTGSTVELTPTPMAGDQPTWIRRPTPVQFQGGSFKVSLDDIPDDAGLQAIISLTHDNGIDSFDIVVDAGSSQLFARAWDARGFTDLQAVPFDKFDTPWLGLRESGGRMFFERGETEADLVPFFDVEADVADWLATLYIGADNFEDLAVSNDVSIEAAIGCFRP